GRGSSQRTAPYPLVSQLRVLPTRVDRCSSSSRRDRATPFTNARLHSRLGCWLSLLLRHLLLADVFDDPLRRAADRAGLFITRPRRARHRRLSWSLRSADRTRD